MLLLILPVEMEITIKVPVMPHVPVQNYELLSNYTTIQSDYNLLLSIVYEILKF